MRVENWQMKDGKLVAESIELQEEEEALLSKNPGTIMYLNIAEMVVPAYDKARE